MSSSTTKERRPVSLNPKDFEEIDLLKPIHCDAGNAERFGGLFGEDVRYCPALKKWLVWDSRRWKVVP